MELISPAKINLFFKILHKRDDGYHEIASLYQAIDLVDRLFFSFSSSDQITCSNPNIACDHSNLVFKALQLFRTFSKCPPIHIHIEKNIPIQAGLGGGSSNAAATLWGLNQLMGTNFDKSFLSLISSQIGSDVPFFFSNGSSFATSRGEVLKDWKLQASISGFIAKPFFGLSTPEVYKRVDLTKVSKIDPFLALKSFPCFFNDLEHAAFALNPKLYEIKQALLKSFETVVMCGSGSAFFCFNGTCEKIEGVSFFPFKSLESFW